MFVVFSDLCFRHSEAVGEFLGKHLQSEEVAVCGVEPHHDSVAPAPERLQDSEGLEPACVFAELDGGVQLLYHVEPGELSPEVTPCSENIYHVSLELKKKGGYRGKLGRTGRKINYDPEGPFYAGNGSRSPGMSSKLRENDCCVVGWGSKSFPRIIAR